MKNVVIISSSLRRNGNSSVMAQAFEKGAKDAGNNVQLINLKDIELNFCKGCFVCQNLKKCIINDGINDILDTVRTADVLVFATPIYYYSISGQLKTFLDRLNPLYTIGHNFKEIYLLAAAADNDDSSVDGAKKEIQGWIDCFDGVKFVKTIFIGGVNELGDIQKFPLRLNEIYQVAARV
ncbi:MAG: flavodoxin family protein [Candidatus Avigastranaerophilus sp.]